MTSSPRFGIAEWYGHPFVDLPADKRQQLASIALGEKSPPRCPFQAKETPCSKVGGVCSLQLYHRAPNDRIGRIEGEPVITCPSRFNEAQILVKWLARIVGFSEAETTFAKEVPFMRSISTGKSAGLIDFVVAQSSATSFAWYALEVQAVYFSGQSMKSQFSLLRDDPAEIAPFPDAIRRPDWRSSSAKRLMPQLQIKAPTVRRWGSKIAVAVDKSFFDVVHGPSKIPKQELGEGDIIWMVTTIQRSAHRYQLTCEHWEMLTLEDTSKRLLAADTIPQNEFENKLRQKLQPILDTPT